MALGGPRALAGAVAEVEADRDKEGADEDEGDDALAGSTAEGDEADAAGGCISVSRASEAGGSGGRVSGVKMLRC